MLSFIRKQPAYLLPLVIAGLAAGLRLIHLGRHSLWFDEALSYLIATLPAPDILANKAHSSHPPLYYLLLHLWQPWLPDTDTALRLLSVLWGLLLVPGIYRLTHTLFGRRRPALFAALLVAISPFHLIYSQELRMYTQLMFLVTAGVWAYWQGRQRGGRRWWVLYALLFLAAVYTHLFALLPLGATALHALLYRQERPALGRTFLIVVLVALALTPWVATIPGQTESELGTLRPLLTSGDYNPIKPLTTLVFLLFGSSQTLPYSGAALFLTLALAIIFLLELRKGRWEPLRSSPALMLLLILVVCTLGLPLAVYMVRPFFLPERTMAAASPFLIILLARAATRRPGPLPYLAGLAALLMLAGSILFLTGELVKPPYREAMDFIANRYSPGDRVLHTSDGSYLPTLRYVNWSDHAVLAGDPDPRRPESFYELLGGEVWTLEETALQGERLWLVVALEHSVEWQQEQAQYFADHYPEVMARTFEGIYVFLYHLQPASEG